MSDSPIQVQAIDHVTIVVTDLERSRKFYVETLGMTEVPRPDFSFKGSWFQAGSTQIHLILQYEQSGPAGNLEGEETRSTRSHHYAFEVADAQACSDYLKSKGYPLISEAKARPDGAVQVFVTDPDGHIVELCSPPTKA